MSHQMHYLLNLLHGYRLDEALIILPRYYLGYQSYDPIYILSPISVVFYHDLLEMVGELLLNLFSGFHLGPIGFFEFVDLRPQPIADHRVMEEFGISIFLPQPFNL